MNRIFTAILPPWALVDKIHYCPFWYRHWVGSLWAARVGLPQDIARVQLKSRGEASAGRDYLTCYIANIWENRIQSAIPRINLGYCGVRSQFRRGHTRNSLTGLMVLTAKRRAWSLARERLFQSDWQDRIILARRLPHSVQSCFLLPLGAARQVS